MCKELPRIVENRKKLGILRNDKERGAIKMPPEEA
jgi:hypothetical protein